MQHSWSRWFSRLTTFGHQRTCKEEHDNQYFLFSSFATIYKYALICYWLLIKQTIKLDSAVMPHHNYKCLMWVLLSRIDVVGPSKGQTRGCCDDVLDQILPPAFYNSAEHQITEIDYCHCRCVLQCWQVTLYWYEIFDPEVTSDAMQSLSGSVVWMTVRPLPWINVRIYFVLRKV